MSLFQLDTFLHLSAHEPCSSPPYDSRPPVLITQVFLGFTKICMLFCLSFSTVLAGKVFTDGFESGNLNGIVGNGSWGGTQGSVSVSAANPRTGRYSLKMSFAAENKNGYSFTEKRFNLGGYYPDLWVKYDFFVPANYYHDKNTKGHSSNNKGFMFLWAGSYGGENREGPILGNGFWRKSGGVSEVVLWAGARINGKKTLDKNWNCSACGDGKYGNAISANDRGRWMTIIVHAKYATNGNDDGVYEMWKTDWQGNTVKMIDVHNGPWYATKPNSLEPARGFNQGYLLGWANAGFNEETVFYIDNIEFSTTPLRPNAANATAATAISAPKPPTMTNR